MTEREQSPRRSWAVFADTDEPRVVLIAQQAPEGMHWNTVRMDRSISTERVKVWVDVDSDGPIMIEATGLESVDALAEEIDRVTGVGELWSPTLGNPALAPSWVWWHDDLAIDP